MVLANANDYKLIELLNRNDVYYIYGHDEDNELDKLYKECIEEKISEYRGSIMKNHIIMIISAYNKAFFVQPMINLLKFREMFFDFFHNIFKKKNWVIIFFIFYDL
jgi:hypothetical protein